MKRPTSDRIIPSAPKVETNGQVFAVLPGPVVSIPAKKEGKARG